LSNGNFKIGTTQFDKRKCLRVTPLKKEQSSDQHNLTACFWNFYLVLKTKGELFFRFRFYW